MGGLLLQKKLSVCHRRAAVKSLGLTPGPKFREVLDAAANLKLEGVLTSREAAMDWARAYLADNP